MPSYRLDAVLEKTKKACHLLKCQLRGAGQKLFASKEFATLVEFYPAGSDEPLREELMGLGLPAAAIYPL